MLNHEKVFDRCQPHFQAKKTIYQYTSHNCLCFSEEKVEHLFHHMKHLQKLNQYLF